MAVSQSIPEELLPHFYSAIGMIVTNWSFTENALDHWTAIAFHDFEGRQFEKRMPRMFSSKVAFLRKCFDRIDGLEPFKSDAMSVITRCVELSDMRHYVIHGTLFGFDAEDNETFVFRKIDVSADRKEHVLGEMRLPGNHLVAGGTELIGLARFAQKVSARMVAAAERR